MKPRPRHTLAATAALALLTVPLSVPLAGSAVAQSDAPPASTAPGRAAASRSSIDIERVRERCLTAIDRRATSLDSLDNRVTNARYLSDAQEADLHETIAETRSRLSALRSEIEGDTDLTELRDDCRRIVEENRVYLLLAPQVWFLGAADSAQTAVTKIDEIVPTLQTAIDEAAAGGADVTEATRLLEAVKASAANADTLSQNVLTTVSPLTPADYNDGTAAPILRQARADLKTVAQNLRSARADIMTIRTLLG